MKEPTRTIFTRFKNEKQVTACVRSSDIYVIPLHDFHFNRMLEDNNIDGDFIFTLDIKVERHFEMIDGIKVMSDLNIY